MNVQNEPLWQWPSSVPSDPPMTSKRSQASEETRESSNADTTPESSRKTYPHRTCRICLESVPPTFHPPSENLPGFLQPKPRVVYESSDPELGRLLRPCKCKGSSRYVHEGCLQSWRHADPDYGKRNYWQCPTCGFQYRMERLKWAHWISGTLTQIGLTLSILLLTVFCLGFIADPIINLYVDPVETIFHTEYWESSTVSQALPTQTRASWVEHFVKGLASLGVLSFVKAILALSPWQWWNIRTSGVVSSGRTTGRSRVASISWVVIIVGVLSFLWAVWKGVRTWSRKMLEKAGERVMDVPLPDDEDEDEDASSSSAEQPGSSKKDY